MRSGRPLLGDGSAGSGSKNKRNNSAGGGNGGENDSFVSRISEYFMRWKVRPDVVLRGRHENKSKGALSAFWQARTGAAATTTATTGLIVVFQSLRASGRTVSPCSPRSFSRQCSWKRSFVDTEPRSALFLRVRLNGLSVFERENVRR